MSKVLAVTDDLVTIGCDGGILKDVRRCDLNFEPVVGDEVEVFEADSRILVSRKEVGRPTQGWNGDARQGGDGNINIHIDNNSNNAIPTAVAVNPGAKVVNKMAYALLAILLGGVGAQYFYAGKIGAGIICILFCWSFIPALVGLVQGIIALTKSADAAGNIVVS